MPCWVSSSPTKKKKKGQKSKRGKWEEKCRLDSFVSYTPYFYPISNVYVKRTSSQFEGYPKLDSADCSSEATGGYPNWLENIESQANWNPSSLSLVSQRMVSHICIIKDWKNATLSYFILFAFILKLPMQTWLSKKRRVTYRIQSFYYQCGPTMNVTCIHDAQIIQIRPEGTLDISLIS